MNDTDAPPRHLYVHIPFCPRVCPYCGFHVATVNKRRMDACLDHLLGEYHAIAGPTRWSTIYFGGGTPTVLSTEMLHRLLTEVVEPPNDGRREVTIECNPCTLSPPKVARLLAGGITRFSIGVQSFDSAVLATLGRAHSVAAIRQCIEAVRRAGGANVNLDLMFGVPNQTVDSWRATLRAALAYEPQHLSCYALSYEEDTAFFQLRQRDELRHDVEREAEMYRLGREILAAAGYEHYEVSNYARPGFACRHNLAYWRGADYAAIGPSAVSTIRGTRRRNSGLDANGTWTVEVAEPLDARTRAAERMALGLRTSAGVNVEAFARDFGFSPLERWRREVERLRTHGLMHLPNGETGPAEKRLALTERGLAVADEVATEFM